ncbi:MAG: NAD(P)/FAD-dependent oxidoreductase [bacterium]|nr:NAD(P)/FAD-dependent oxidoreductase [bacterium]
MKQIAMKNIIESSNSSLEFNSGQKTSNLELSFLRRDTMAKYDYDIIIIGGGGAGITAATLSAGLGKKTAMIDKKKFGGECTWSGCVPSKALLQSAKASHVFSNMKKYGLAFSGKAALKTDNVMKSVRDVVNHVYSGEKPDHFENSGITAIEDGDIRFRDAHSIDLTIKGETKIVTSDKFLIATGSAPMVPPIEGIDSVPFYTNENIFSLKKIPKSLIVMGGGPIGIELASAFNRLGAKVTVIEMAPVILFREEEELSGILTEKLPDEGLTILTGAKVVKVEGSSTSLTTSKKTVTVHYLKDDVPGKISGEALIIAAGRKPNLEDLDLEKAGIEFTGRGITVNDHLQTSAKNIYAAGDVVGPYQFSHIANYQAIIAASNALLPINKKAQYDHVPWVTFTDPELARSGLLEKEALEKYGRSIKVFRASYAAIDRAKTDRNETGIAKVVCHKNGKILGIHILGERAGELMQELHLAKTLGIPLHKLNDVIHAYPGYSDVVKQLARLAYIDKIQNHPVVKIIKAVRRD